MFHQISALFIYFMSVSNSLNLRSSKPPHQRTLTKINFVSGDYPVPQWFDLLPNSKILFPENELPTFQSSQPILDEESLKSQIPIKRHSFLSSKSIIVSKDSEVSAWRLPDVGAWRTLVHEQPDEEPPTLRAYIYGTIELQASHQNKVTEIWDIIKKKGSMRHLSEDDANRVIEALRVSYVALYGRSTQRSLEPMINRVRGTAAVLGELKADVTVVIAAILHEVIVELSENSSVREQLEFRFGKNALNVAEKYSKLPKFMARKALYTPMQSEYHIQMLVSSAEDYRALYIRIADRLHTMRILRSLPLDNAEMKKIAQEALHVYAPLAHKMGVMKVKGELEDLAFRVLDPEMFQKSRYTQIAANKAFQEAADQIQELLLTDDAMKEHKATCRLTYRIKDKYQLYLKMTRKGLKSPSDVRDALGLRIIIENPIRDNETPELHELRAEKLCYHMIGKIRAMEGWSPSSSGFKDYIAGVKDNGYKSLHQYIKNKALGTNVEVQVRTKEMHRTAELGVAAHWYYKDQIYRPEVADSKLYRLAWRSQQQATAKSPAELIGMAKQQLRASRVFVFLEDSSTVINLRAGSTAIDAAMAIRAELGLTAFSISLKGRKIDYSQPLLNGDVIAYEVSSDVSPLRYPVVMKESVSPNAAFQK